MAVKSKNKTKKQAKPQIAKVEALEPFPDTGEVIAHEGLTLIDVADPADLSSLLANKQLKDYILARLSETEALVLPEHSQSLLKALRKAGYTPKVL